MKVKVLAAQCWQTLCDPMDCSLPGSSVYGVSRQEFWSGLPCPPPGNLPNPGIKPRSPAFIGRFFTTSATVLGFVFISQGCHFDSTFYYEA